MDKDFVNDSLERDWTDTIPFANWRYIRQRAIDSTGRRLELSQSLFPQAAAVLERLAALDTTTAAGILEHPFLRCVVFAATQHLKHAYQVTTKQQVERYLEELERLLAEGWVGGELPSLSPLISEEYGADERHTIRLWTGDQDDSSLMGVIPTVLLKNNPACIFHLPTRQDYSNICRGIELFRELFPSLAPSVLRHIDVITLITTRPANGEFETYGVNPLSSDTFISSSSDTPPGVIFVSPSVLPNPWYAAEILLHEGLHSKLYDVMATHNLLRPNYKSEEAAQIHPLWHRSAESWDVHRSLFAMHVYAHLAFFFQRAATRFDSLEPRFGRLHVVDATLSMRRSLDRAHFLGAELADVGADDLGPAGRLLLTQLDEMLCQLENGVGEQAAKVGAPPDAGEVAQRLVGDLYARQTLALERVLDHWHTIASHPQGSAGIPALVDEVARLDAGLVETETVPPASDQVEDALRALIDLRTQVVHRLANGATSPSFETLTDSVSRSARLFAKADITVALNP